MTQFVYEAKDKGGHRRKGTVEAQDATLAKEKIKSQGLILLSIHPKSKTSIRLSQEELLLFTFQLSQLLGASLPLYESLGMVYQNLKDTKTAHLVNQIMEEIKKGQPLSATLSKFPQTFDSRYRALVASGEAVGALDVIFDRIRELLEKEMKVRKALISALVYPLILTTFSFVVIGVLLLFVVPSVEGMFTDREVHGLTAFVFSLSHLIRGSPFFLSFSFVLLLISSFLAFKTTYMKKKIVSLFLSLPILGPLLLDTALSRFARTLGTLLEEGVPLPEGLNLGKSVLNHPSLEKVIEKSRERVLEGRKLSDEWKKSHLFPPFFLQLIAMGEETGSLGKMFLKGGTLLESQLETKLERLLTLVQPLILILLGGVIGLVMISILLPMSEIANFQN